MQVGFQEGVFALNYPYKTGIQLNSVRSDLARDFEGTLASLAEMGYEGVEFAGLYGKKPEEAKALCAKYRLEPISAHVALEEMLADPDGVFAACKQIGCSYIAVPYLTEDRRPLRENYEETIGQIEALTKKAKTHGLDMLFHNHYFEFVRLPGGKYGYDDLFSRIPDIGAEIDTCWVNVAGEDPCTYLNLYAERIPLVHFKDFMMLGTNDENRGCMTFKDGKPYVDFSSFEYRPLGYGAQDVPKMISALDGSVCTWIIVEQDEPSMGKNRMECAKMSIDYLKSLK